MYRAAQVISVIRTELERRGQGVESDPIRIITQYWTLDGELLAEVDPYTERLDGGKHE